MVSSTSSAVPRPSTGTFSYAPEWCGRPRTAPTRLPYASGRVGCTRAQGSDLPDAGDRGTCYPSFRGEETKEDLRPAFLLLVVPSDGARAAVICYGAAPAKGRIVSVMENDAAVGHVVLLGDSVFDNAAYVAGAPDVVRQVR